jgi:L,D-transpeptidase YbiS
MARRKRLLIGVAVLGIFSAAVLGASYYIGLRQVSGWRSENSEEAAENTEAAKVDRQNATLKRRLENTKPRGIHIVIDTGENRLYLKRGEKVIREAVVSCGSGGILKEPGGKERTWVFDTPRGEFRVKSKISNPYWVKPDWAFIEEGKPIPKNVDDRVEAGTLGDYALGFGDGYFIHGTLYTRLLGRNVTHGCVRVGDEDLKAVFSSVRIGTRIYIY